MIFNNKKLFFLGLFLCLGLLNTLKAQDDVVLYIDSAGVTVDPMDPTLYTVPLKVENFTGVAGLDLTIVSTNMNGIILDVQNPGNIPANGLTVNLLSSTSFTAVFLDFSGAGITLDDGTIFFNIIMQIEGDLGDCFPLAFEFLEVVKADNPGEAAPSLSLGGQVCLALEANISGTILAPTIDLIDLDSTIIKLTSTDSTYVDTCDMNGAYDVAVALDATYTVMPMGRADETTRAELLSGINVADLVVIIRHLLGLEPFSNPYQFLAADVNMDNEVSIEDLFLIQSFILGKIEVYPSGMYWRYVDATYVFPNPSQPFDNPIPASVEVPNLTGGVTSVNFIGVRLGDVDFSGY